MHALLPAVSTLSPPAEHEHEWRLHLVEFEEHGPVTTYECAACAALRVE